MPKEFTPIEQGGTGYAGIRASNPDPNRRYHIKISDDLCMGPDGLREFALWLADFADETDPQDKPTLIRSGVPMNQDVPPQKNAKPAPAKAEPKAEAKPTEQAPAASAKPAE